MVTGRASDLIGAPSSTTVGLQSRVDLVHNGLYHSEARSRLSASAVSRITEASLSSCAETETRWTPWLRTSAGLRADAIGFKVSDLKAGGSAERDASLLTPKLELALGPSARTELYADIAYRHDPRFSLGLSVFNLFDAKTSDIDDYYVSRLRGEPAAGVADIHTHPPPRVSRELDGVVLGSFGQRAGISSSASCRGCPAIGVQGIVASTSVSVSGEEFPVIAIKI